MLGEKKLVGFVATTDFARARAFYGDVLGLKFLKDDGFALVFEASGVMVRVAKVPGEFKPAPYTVLGWEVSAIEDVVRGLTARGVTFERFGFFQQDELGVWAAPGGDKVAWFKDPDGNMLSLSQHVGR